MILSEGDVSVEAIIDYIERFGIDGRHDHMITQLRIFLFHRLCMQFCSKLAVKGKYWAIEANVLVIIFVLLGQSVLRRWGQVCEAFNRLGLESRGSMAIAVSHHVATFT